MVFEYLMHTADLRAAVTARTLPDLYADGTALVRDILVGNSVVLETSCRALLVPPAQPGERFFRFVRELVFLGDSEAFLPARVETPDLAADLIRVFGEPFDPSRHHGERQIKALTRHGYSFEHGPEGYRAVLLFDL